MRFDTACHERFELKVPFFANPDNTHCYQACIRMGLAYIKPKERFTWRRVDAIVRPTPDSGSCPLASLSWMRSNDLETLYCSTFDYGQFLVKPFEYLVARYGKYNAILMREDGYMDWILETIHQHLAESGWVMGIPTLDDLRTCILNGYITICGIYLGALDNGNHTGHAVLVKGFIGTDLVVHDPGPPGRPNRLISFDLFDTAWSSPHIRGKELVAIRPAEAGF